MAHNTATDPSTDAPDRTENGDYFAMEVGMTRQRSTQPAWHSFAIVGFLLLVVLVACTA